ncbi:MAG: hypothetical protein COB53_11585 [Elusimicrobia bacterium]|nr:MAG: hypothetical protein COB53_11585 [Elusimicrobiota bacterium]
MKKLLGTAIAAILLFPVTSVNAEVFKNLKVSGNLDIQMNSARNVLDFDAAAQDRISGVGTRTMLHMDWDLLDDVHSKVTLRKNDTVWGTAASGGQGAAGGSQAIGHRDTAGTATNGILGNVFIDQANFTIDKLLGHFDTTVGRQFYGEPGSLNFYWGPRDTQDQDVTSFDAVRVNAENDWMKVTAIGGMITAVPNGTAGADSNTKMKGINIGWKGLPLKVNTYLWNRLFQGTGVSGSVAGRNDNLYTYGLKLAGESDWGWFSAEFAKQSGECRSAAAGRCGTEAAAAHAANYTGHAFLAELGFNADVANVGGISPWASFGLGTGQSDSLSGTQDGFQSVASDWRPGVINRRFSGAGAGAGSDVLGGGVGAGGSTTTGLSNRVVYGIGTNFTPAAMDQLTVGVQAWDFRRQRNDVQVAVASGNKHIGTEVAVTANWAHSENVSLSAGVARFFTGGFIKEQLTSDSPASFIFSDVSLRF